MRPPLALFFFALLGACGTRTISQLGTSGDGGGDVGTDTGACAPLAIACLSVNCPTWGNVSAPPCAAAKMGIHPGLCGSFLTLVEPGIDSSTTYVYDPTTKKLVGIIADAGTTSTCYGEVGGACTTSPVNICGGG